MIERSTQMKEGAKTKIQDKFTVEREAQLRERLSLREKLKRTDNRRLRARAGAAIFVIFLKCTLEKGLGCF